MRTKTPLQRRLIAGLCGLLVVCRSTVTAAPASVGQYDAVAANQSQDFRDRAQFIERAVSAGLLLVVDLRRDVPRVTVGGAFYTQPLRLREQLITAVYRQCADLRPRCVVVIHDQLSGREVGQFDWVEGLRWR